jgi:hypothetical protein
MIVGSNPIVIVHILLVEHTRGVSNKSVQEAARIDEIPCHVARKVDYRCKRALLAARPGLSDIDRRKNLRRSSLRKYSGCLTSRSTVPSMPLMIPRERKATWIIHKITGLAMRLEALSRSALRPDN